MYTRSYYNEHGEGLKPPENYDGVTFSCQNEEKPTENTKTPEVSVNANPWETEAAGAVRKTDGERRGEGGIFSKIPFLSGILGRADIPILGSLSLPKIGSEEILIIGAALFLFFSKEGDRQCALMLLLLLLIS